MHWLTALNRHWVVTVSRIKAFFTVTGFNKYFLILVLDCSISINVWLILWLKRETNAMHYYYFLLRNLLKWEFCLICIKEVTWCCLQQDLIDIEIKIHHSSRSFPEADFWERPDYLTLISEGWFTVYYVQLARTGQL